MRALVTSGIELAGIAAVCAGVYLLAPFAVGLMVTGAALVTVGYFEGRK